MNNSLPSPRCTLVQMPPADVQNSHLMCSGFRLCYSFSCHSRVLERYVCVSECAHVCKLIISVGWRLEDILGTRAMVRFFCGS